MTTRARVLTLALCFVSLTLCFAQDANMGTWKLNEARSEIGPGAPKNTTLIYEAVGDRVKVTVDGVDANGKPTHNEWIGKFDGKDYAVTGDPTSDARSYTRIDDRTLGLNIKKGRRITVSGRIVVSADGKRRTVTVRGVDANGRKFRSNSVYDKQ